MIYQVRANLYFDSEDEAKDFYHDCDIAIAKATFINPDSENSEFSIIERIDNHHDDDPNGPCYLILAHINQPPPQD